MYYIRDMNTLGKRLTWARERKGLTQEGLAKLSGVSQSTVGNLEAGIRQTARRIIDIAAALDVDPAWLANGKGAPPEIEEAVVIDSGAMQHKGDEGEESADELLKRMAEIIETYRLAGPGDRERIDFAVSEARQRIFSDNKTKAGPT